MTLDELRPHLHTLPDHPDWIPYRTTYYHRTWGFCLTQRRLDELDDGPYDVVVDSTLEPGELTYGELVIPGDSEEEVLLSAHVCHPSLANDNLSGIAVATELARDPGRAAPTSLDLPLAVRPRDHRVDHLAERATPRRPRGSGTGWCSPVWAVRDRWSTSAPGTRTGPSTGPPRTS